MKTCGKCQTEKPFADFSKRGEGYQSWCKKCAHARRAEWARENPKKIKEYRIYDNYKLRPSEYEAMLEKQNGLCAICDAILTDSIIHIDHDHQTLAVRGILCNHCNMMLGWYESIKDHDRVRSYLGYR